MQREHIVFLRYFPPNHTQRVVAVDRKVSTVYFNLFGGKILNQIRLDYYNDLSFLNQQSFRHAVDWFLDIELRRAEHVSDAYRTTLHLDPDAGECAGQRIHRFYFNDWNTTYASLSFIQNGFCRLSGCSSQRA
jgi:hypothetical protein